MGLGKNFEYTPWESKESEYYLGCEMLAEEWFANAPDNYRTTADPIGNLAGPLRVYLIGHYNQQPLL